MIWCQPEPAMFCAHLSQNLYGVQLLPGWYLFYGSYDQPTDHSRSFYDYQLDINGITNLIRNHMIYCKQAVALNIYIAIKLYDGLKTSYHHSEGNKWGNMKLLCIFTVTVVRIVQLHHSYSC